MAIQWVQWWLQWDSSGYSGSTVESSVVSGRTVEKQWGHSGGHGPGPVPRWCHILRTSPGTTPYPGYLTTHPCTTMSPRVAAGGDTVRGVRARMSKIRKLVPKGCLEKQLSVVSRASTNHAGLTVSVHHCRDPLARPTFLVRNDSFSQK